MITPVAWTSRPLRNDQSRDQRNHRAPMFDGQGSQMSIIDQVAARTQRSQEATHDGQVLRRRFQRDRGCSRDPGLHLTHRLVHAQRLFEELMFRADPDEGQQCQPSEPHCVAAR